MVDEEKIKKDSENVNNYFEKDIFTEKARKLLFESLQNYKETIRKLTLDIPIQSLCLKKKTEKLLINNGIFRVYDISDINLAKVEGLDDSTIANLTSIVDQLLLMG